jgi:intergrase/recombinase
MKLQVILSSSLFYIGEWNRSLSVSLEMDKTQYRALIKFLVKEGLIPNEIHSKFIKDYEDSSHSLSTIK